MSDKINHPSHYTQGAIECIDAIESALTPEEFRGWLKGSAMKYIWRAGRKNDAAEDIGKAQWFLKRLLQQKPEPPKPIVTFSIPKYPAA
jgi:hypothetical protein